jgi:membrane protease YdiL (CAAX protease family)
VTASAPPASGRPIGPLKAAGWTVLFLAGGFALTLALAFGGFAISGGLVPGESGPRPLVIQTVSGLASFGLLTWAIGRRALRLSLEELRWKPLSDAPRGFGRGLLLGVAAATVALGLSVLMTDAEFLPDAGGPRAYVLQLAKTALLLAPAALLEELVFRGVGQVVLARAVGRLPAILTLSVLFALAHAGNPDSTPLALLNIALAGIFLGLVFYAPGGIWAAWGAHLGWNATLAALDAPVSGLPFRIPWIDYRPGGPSWLTGGSFGPEGGLLATVALVGAIGVAWRWSRKELT